MSGVNNPASFYYILVPELVSASSSCCYLLSSETKDRLPGVWSCIVMAELQAGMALQSSVSAICSSYIKIKIAQLRHCPEWQISDSFTVLTILGWRSILHSIQTITYSSSVPEAIKQSKIFVSASGCRLSVVKGKEWTSCFKACWLFLWVSVNGSLWLWCFGICFSVWWVDCGWTPRAHQSHSVFALLIWAGRKYDGKLMSWGKNRERSLTSDHHGQDRLNLGKLAQFISNHTTVGEWEIKPNLENTFPPSPSFQA